MIASADFTESTATAGSTTLTGTASWGEDSSDHYYSYSDNEYKSEELDLWMVIARKEWREYLRALWLDVLGAKQYLNVIRFSKCRLYYRQLLYSVSGWLARVGKNKKN